jgi:hypothetical protein
LVHDDDPGGEDQTLPGQGRGRAGVSAQQPEEKKDVGVYPTFRKIADLFLADSLADKKPTTYKMHRYFLQDFRDHIGRKRVNDLKGHHVTEWVEKVRPKVKKWGQSIACSGRTTILACLTWAVGHEPLQGARAGRATPRRPRERGGLPGPRPRLAQVRTFNL